ncbi:MAG: xanthine dehydrogenase family protein subunit M [Pseudomonadota bacterium]
MYEFEFIRPKNIAGAVEALASEDAQVLAGGQTLLPTMKQRLASPETLVSVAAIKEMIGLCTDDDGRLCIGAATTHAQVAAQSNYRALAQMAAHIGDPAVRNRGTIGGSLANNDPAACYPSAVLASDATVVTNMREIPADAYFQGLFTTALEEGELIIEVKFPIPEAACYKKFLQPASRFALVGVFVAKFPDRCRVAVTGASEDGVFRWSDAEEALNSEFSSDALASVLLEADGMISDVHGSASYRSHIAGVMAQRAVSEIVAET